MKTTLEEIDGLRIAETIRADLKEYIRLNHLQALVIGISGGIDSAVTALLALPVCRELEIPLCGRSITIESNSEEEQSRAREVGNVFCTDFKEVDLTHLYVTTRDAVEETVVSTPSQDDRVRRGNIKARLRMIYLYNLAQRQQGMVLSTDNRTEYMLGFWTLHGDVGDYTPLFGLWKTEVYALARVLLKTLETARETAALQACIDCLPTDGLGISSSDVEQLRAKDYEEVDATLVEYLRGDSLRGNPNVIGRLLSSEYKRNHPKVLTREKLGLQPFKTEIL